MDETQITEQLGSLPANALSVVARCPAGHPSVISCYPLRQTGKRVVPFPTLYWLTCPRVCAQLSHLERDGVISTITAELAESPDLQAALQNDHEKYIAQRWALLSRTDRLLVAELGLANAFQSRGIGGMSNFTAIKCLHLHVAHDLASGSTIGKLIAKRYGFNTCATE